MKHRQSNIELCRILAMVGVIILHYNNSEIGGGFRYVRLNSINYLYLIFLQSIAVACVNLFVMISGFFLCRSNKRFLGRAIALFLQISIYSLSMYTFRIIAGMEQFSIKNFVFRFLPKNWFVVLYVVLYLISPLINKAFEGLRHPEKVIVGLIILFSVWPTAVDILNKISGNDFSSLSSLGLYGSNRGYTITNFILCYIIGAAINRIDIKRMKQKYLVQFWVFIIGLIFLWAFFDKSTAWEYCNPLVIMSAAVFLCIYLKIDIGINSLINKVADISFSVYLLHNAFFQFFKIDEFVQKNLLIMTAHIAITIFVIILVVFFIDLIYKKVFSGINHWLRKSGAYSI